VEEVVEKFPTQLGQILAALIGRFVVVILIVIPIVPVILSGRFKLKVIKRPRKVPPIVKTADQ
jgi:hypothetical protein